MDGKFVSQQDDVNEIDIERAPDGGILVKLDFSNFEWGTLDELFEGGFVEGFGADFNFWAGFWFFAIMAGFSWIIWYFCISKKK